jgi:membrane protease YdiL (CAAX protease family)
MRRIKPITAAVSVGAVFGIWHLLWVTLIATGVAKPILDFVLKLHFLQFEYALAPFVASTAITLVGLTFAIGAVLGLLFALVWNWLSRNPEGRLSDGRPAFGSR